jgi:Zn-dependent protease with chaperone function/Flp pilus assembly protein TadD
MAIVVLLALAVAPPTTDGRPPAQVLMDLNKQLQAALLVLHNQPALAAERLDAVLNDARLRERARTDAMIRMQLDHAAQFRAQARIQMGDARGVADDMTEQIGRQTAQLLARVAGLTAALGSPVPNTPLRLALTVRWEAPLNRWELYRPLQMRAQAWQMLGEKDRAQADTDLMDDILRETSLMQPRPPHPNYRFPLSWRLDAEEWARPIGWLLAPSVVLMFTPIFYLIGMRQRRDGNGTRKRLLAVAFALAVAQAAPVLVTVALLNGRPQLLDSPAVIGVACAIFFANVVVYCSYVIAVTWMNSKQAPPLLADAAVLERIRELAGRMGVAVPVARLVRSPSSQQLNEALVAGLAAPTLVLFDGILYRLSEDERDVIIAHELAHIANHTFWWRLLVTVAVSVAVIVASGFLFPPVALALGWGLISGALLILSRRLELDCDRRAAGAIGHRRAASALWKIHADQPFRRMPVLEFLIGATSTHPSRDERLAAVRRAAPPDDQPDVEWDPRLLFRRQLASWLATGVWMLALLGCVLGGYAWPRSYWPALPLVGLALTPTALLWLGLRQAHRRRRRLTPKPGTWLGRLTWGVGLVTAVLIAATYFRLTDRLLGQRIDDTVQPIALIFGSLTFLGLLFLSSRRRVEELERKIMIAIQSAEYAQALELCEKSPALVAKSHALRHNRALILALLGHKDEAMAELEQLLRDAPAFKLSLMLLAALYSERGRYADALALAETLTRDLPDEPAGPLAQGWYLRKLGRLDEAEAKARQAQQMEPQAAEVHLALAGVALDRGDHAAAREQLAQAERLSPGTVSGALLAAELALAADDPDVEAIIEKALAAVRNNPLAFAEREVAMLKRRLAERRGGDEDGPLDEVIPVE